MRCLKLLVLASLVLFLLAGCKSTQYRWISTTGLPADTKRTFVRKNMKIEYCLVRDSADGDYYFEGLARSGSGRRIGKITSADFKLALFNGDEMVKLVSLFEKGRDLDKSISLHKTFHYDGSFDYVGFGWKIRYMY